MKIVPTRLDDDLVEGVDALAEQMGMKRSQLIRYVLQRATGDPAIKAMLSQEVYGMQARLQPVMHDLYKDFVVQARDRFAEALGVQLNEEGVVELEPVQALPPGRSRALPAEGGVEGATLRGVRKRGLAGAR